MTFKSPDGRDTGLRNIHQMMVNEEFEVVQKDTEKDSLERVVIENPEGERTEWVREEDKKQTTSPTN